MRRTLTELQRMKGQTPIVMVTAYDATLARLVDASVDAILVGDSLGMVVQGRDSTVPVTLDEMVYHTRMVARGSEQALLVGDLPFMSYQPSVELALLSAGRLLKEGHAQAVKLEGGEAVVPAVRALVAAGVPVVGHLGLTPQSINVFGGFGKRGKSDTEARRLLDDAKALEAAGLGMLVLENIPHALAEEVTGALAIPTIGIGAGPHCDGQVQVLHDLVGLIPEFTPRHAQRLTDAGEQIRGAVSTYAEQVRKGTFLSR
ncbi:MAG TPA: 3-methyl-2-oxobutanoate hydroxymethyltransferase [bacterium]|nr:3-methyl-2-oxobutanoate hydroxymethyltransferase [bacterium]